MNREAIDELRRAFLTQAKDFTSFEHAGDVYSKNEDEYKRKAVTEAQALLKPYVLGTSVLSTHAQASEFGNVLFDLTNFLNWRDRSYINDGLFKKDGDWLIFMQKMLECLKSASNGNWQLGLADILKWLKEHDCPANISKMLPLYFLFLWDPKNHFFLKSSILDRFLAALGEKKLGQGVSLTVEGYEGVLKVIRTLSLELQAWKPRDNVDVQSFAYLAARAQDEGVIPKPIDGSSIQRGGTKPPVDPQKTPPIPRNIILAGPPGTGKTFRLMTEYASHFEEEVVAQSEEDFIRELGSTLTWRDSAALALAMQNGKAKVSELALNRIVQAKYAFQGSPVSVKAKLWAYLQLYSSADCPNVNLSRRCQPGIFWKDENSVWSFAPGADEHIDNIHELAKKLKAYKPQRTRVRRFETITFHQSYGYEDFVEGIRPIPPGDEDEPSVGVRYEVVDGIFKHMVNRAKLDPSHNYALFIDEINRGNISSIFGELITLIEDDKRQKYAPASKSWEGHSVKLPYSHSLVANAPLFGVPDNLFVIGTMNTADRSIALMDLALRRRFTFRDVPPDTDVLATIPGPIKTEQGEIDLAKMLERINQRIEYLYDRDHAIGHSYLMNCRSFEDLLSTFTDKVLPLLQEYFYGDWEKIQMVLGDLVDGVESDGKNKAHPFAIVRHTIQKPSSLFGLSGDAYQDRRSYALTDELAPKCFQKIYTKV